MAAPVLPAAVRPAAAPRHVQELVSRWLAMWNGDLALAGDLIAADFRVHLPRFGMPAPELVHDPATMAWWIGMFRQSYAPDAAFRCVLGPFAVGDHVISRFWFTGTWTGGRPAVAVAPPGTPVEFAGVDILRLDGGRIAEYWLTDDQLDLYAQLGAVREA